MEQLETEEKCREIENKLVMTADLIQLLTEHFDSDEINDDGLRIIQSTLATILEMQKDIIYKFSELPR